jgi:chitin synthase
MYRLTALQMVLSEFAAVPDTAEQQQMLDLGEDRYMCTLMIMRGWQLIYCSGAHAYTSALETMHDLWVQRRRWNVSTYGQLVEQTLPHPHKQ